MVKRYDGLDLMPTQTVVLKSDGRIAYANNAWNKFAASNGYKGRDFIGLNYLGACEAACGAEKPQADYFAKNLRSVLDGSTPSFELVYPCHGPSTKRWFKAIATNHGEHSVVTHVDITLQQEHFRHVTLFYENAKVMHDLRSPLAAILGFTEIATELPVDEWNRAKVLEYFGLIRSSGTQMLDIVDDILRSARDPGVRQGIKEETVVPLRPLGEEIQTMLRPLCQRYDVRLDLDISDTFVWRGDRNKLWKILTNLISNAVKHNRPDGSVTVTAGVNASGGIEINVNDTGVGMPPETLDRIFEPFARLSTEAETPTYNGAGLGLAIVRELVRELDGAIVVSSKVGTGSEFIVQFPGWRTVGGEVSLTA